MSEYSDPVVLLKMVRRLQGVEDEAIALAQMNDKLRHENADLSNRLGLIVTILEDAIEALHRKRNPDIIGTLHDALECARDSDWYPK